MDTNPYAPPKARLYSSQKDAPTWFHLLLVVILLLSTPIVLMGIAFAIGVFAAWLETIIGVIATRSLMLVFCVIAFFEYLLALCELVGRSTLLALEKLSPPPN